MSRPKFVDVPRLGHGLVSDLSPGAADFGEAEFGEDEFGAGDEDDSVGPIELRKSDPADSGKARG